MPSRRFQLACSFSSLIFILKLSKTHFSFPDIGSLATVAVIGIAAIFVLPQAIYWITGINLSSFNWGRSDDDGIPGIVGLANTVDHALTEFNIDGKGCLAKSMCDILHGEKSDDHGVFVKAIANSASKWGNPERMLLQRMCQP